MNKIDSQADFFSPFFKRLEEKGLEYCVLRNYENLPQYVRNDVDIWAHPATALQLGETVREVAAETDWAMISFFPRSGSGGDGDYFLTRISSPPGIIHLDVWTHIYWKGLEYIDAGAFAGNISHCDRGFGVAGHGLQAAMMLLKGLLYHGRVDAKYKEKIGEYSSLDPDSFMAGLVLPFGHRTAKYLLTNSIVAGWQAIEAKAWWFRLVLLLRALSMAPFRQLSHWFDYLCNRIMKYAAPQRGLFLVFMGPDGSGKTTLVELLMQSQCARLFQEKISFHGHFPYLPEIKSMLFWKSAQEKTLPRPQAIRPFGMWRAAIYPLYYGFNHFLGHFLIWKERARGGLVFFDRYFYDYLLINQFSRCPRWLIFTIAKLIPRPDAVIYLKCDPKKIHARKPELPIDEIERQQGICDFLRDRFAPTYTVDTGNAAGVAAGCLEKIVIELVHNKQK